METLRLNRMFKTLQMVQFQLQGKRYGGSIPVILVSALENKGEKGEIIKVKRGYARNFLIPRNIAVYATEDNKELLIPDENGAMSHPSTQPMKKIQIFKHTKPDGIKLKTPLTNYEIKQHLVHLNRISVKRVDLARAIQSLGTYEVKYDNGKKVEIEVVAETRW